MKPPPHPDPINIPAANTSAASDLVRQLCGLECLNLTDRRHYPELSRRLMNALGLVEQDLAREARAYMANGG